MALSYSWHVGALDTYPTASDSQDPVNTENDVVYNVHYTLTVTTGSHSASIIGTQTVGTEDLSSFSSFDGLDNTTVAGWVQAAMEAETTGSVAQRKGAVSSSLAEKMNPVTVVKYLAVSGE
jgi:hypothetical protein